MANALFDNKRRKEIRDALRKGDLAGAMRKRHEGPEMDIPTQPIVRAIEDHRSATVLPMPAPSARAGSQNPVMDSQVMALDGAGLNSADQALFDAIKAQDVSKVADALAMGADVNSRYPHFPRHRMQDTFIGDAISPLGYARQKGNPQIVRMLERSGAKD